MAGHLLKSTVRVPASTSNLGSGFDTLGLALGIYNRITVSRGEGLESTEDPFMKEVADHFFSAQGIAAESIAVTISGDVPRSRGLGSSVTVRCGIYAAMSQLWQADLSRLDIARAVTELEGHPDNAVASVFGGLTVAKLDQSGRRLEAYLSCAVEENLKFIVISPEIEVKTNDSRSLLPGQLPFGDVVRSMNDLSFFLAAMLTGRSSDLRGLSRFEAIHEPYRLAHQPGAAEALEAARQAGSRAAWLSGSGSSLVAVVGENSSAKVENAFRAPFKERGIPVRVFTTGADHHGFCFED